jgi:peptide/nickel transport system permease protein
MSDSTSQRPDADVLEGRPITSWWADVWQRFQRDRTALVAAAVLLIIIAASAGAPVFARYDPAQQFRKEGLSARGEPQPPSAKFWLGTDNLGRDLYSRLLYGGRVSLFVGITASTISVLLALLIGGISGYVGGKLDFGIMRFVDFMMGVPTFFLMLLLILIFSPGVWVIIFVISVFSWTYPARIFRGQVLSIKQQDFIEAAVSIGVPGRRIFFRHILPHVIPLVIVYIALNIPGTIFAEIGLSFIGLGVQPPTASWGSMQQSGFGLYRVAPWVTLFPGLAIMITVIALNLVGTGLREAMDPTRRGR